MRFSLRKALGTPFGWGLPIMGLFIGLPLLTALYVKTHYFIQNVPSFTVLSLVLFVICNMVTFGYIALSGHRYIYNKKPTVPVFGTKLLAVSFKSLLFALCSLVAYGVFVLILYISFVALFAITVHPVIYFVLIPVALFIGILFALYMMTAWARFMDTFRPLIVFHVATNWIFMKRYWTTLVRVVLYVIGATVLLLIPLLALHVIGQLLVKVNIYLIYGYVYLAAVIQAYLYLMSVNVLAQAYAWIKNQNEETVDTSADLTEEEPVIMKDIVVMADVKPAVKKASKPKTSKKTAVVKRTTAKKTAAKK